LNISKSHLKKSSYTLTTTSDTHPIYNFYMALMWSR